MSAVTRVTIAADAFAFGDIFRTDAAATVELLRVVPLGAQVVPYVEVETDDPDAVEAGLRDDPRVADLMRCDRRAETAVYRVEWDVEFADLFSLLRDRDISIEAGQYADGDWTFRLRAPDRDALEALFADCRDQALPLHEDRMSGATRPPASDERPSVAPGALDPFRDIVENLDEAVWLTDPGKSEIHYVNPAYEEIWGRPVDRLYEDPLSVLDTVHPDDRERVRDAFDAQAEAGRDVEFRIERPDGSRRWIHGRAVPIRRADGTVSRIAGIAEDITRQKKRERVLTAINEVMRELLMVDSREQIADAVVRTVSDVLELSLVTVYLFDEDANVLRPVAWSPDVDEILDHPPTFTGTGSLAWDAFVESETRVYADVRTADRTYNPETPIRSELIVPIGDHGLVLVGNRDPDAFEAVDVEFAELLAANTNAALDRIAYERNLERQNERLVELSRLNTVIRSINRTVVNASTRDRIVAEVCEQLVESGPYIAAWVGEYRADDRVTIHATAGDAESVFDGTRISVADADLFDELIRTAIRTRAVHVIQDLRNVSASDAWHERIAERGGRSVATVPLTADEALYGVLTLYSDRPSVFDEVETSVLRELGQTIGRAIRAAEIRRALTAETAVEVEFRVTDPGSWFVATSDALDCRLDLDGVVPLDDRALLHYVTATDADRETLADRVVESSAVELRRVIDETDDGGLFALRVSGPSAIRPLRDYGATIRSAVADRGTGRITVELTPETDVRTVLNGLRDVCPSAELGAKRELDRPVETVQQFRETLTERLTEKQLQALRTAYFAGYFEWPRRSSAEEIADSLDISSATLHFHLRHALDKVLVALFEREPDA